MFLLEKKILDSVVEFIYEKISLETAKKSGYEKLEYDIETMMIEIALLLFQKIINGIDLIEGHSEKLEIKIENKIKIFLKKHSGFLPVLSLFGMIELPYSRYENKQTHKAKLVNHIDYKERDRSSPNVKKNIIRLIPNNTYEKSTNELYESKRINISESGLKDISREIGEEHAEWFHNMVKEKNENSVKKSLKKQVSRMVISDDGGRIKLIQSDRNQGRKTPKKPEWKEIKIGTTFEIDDEGNKSENKFTLHTDLSIKNGKL